jgi:sorbose reductase
MARGLAQSGSSIALLDVLPDVAESAHALAAETGVATIGLEVDVRDAEQVESAFAAAELELGVADTLVTAAGITIWGDSIDVTPEEWHRVMDINLTGTFFACQSWARRLIKHGGGGSAILIASMSGHIVNVPQFQASYNASKAAVIHLAKSLSVEWAAAGIRVNALSPGYTLSDMTRQFMDANPELRDQWEKLIPVGRMAEPEDLIGMVNYLASPASTYLTGQSLVIDGGYSAI